MTGATYRLPGMGKQHYLAWQRKIRARRRARIKKLRSQR
jgi:hypothetical protein